MAISIWKESQQHGEEPLKKISRYRNEIYSNTTAVSFSIFIDEKLREKEMTREMLAIALGYSEGEEAKRKAQTLKHTIGREGYTTNRDRIIAICLALEMSHPETDKALFLYGMLPLSDFDIREKLLIQALTDHIGFSETNRLLKKAGLNPLEIEKTKQTTGPHIIREPMEEFVRISGPTYSYGDFVGDCSLSGLHYPGSYAFDGEMILQDKSGIRYTLETSDGGIYTIKREVVNGTFLSVDMYTSLSECMDGRFSKYFLELEDGIRRKVKEVLSIMDDTRNYMIRFDAEVRNCQLDLFAETFNYNCPEYSEYYQMERINGKFRMTVTHESIFMKRHLGKQYSRFFTHAHDTDEIAAYYSVEDIQKSEESNRSSTYWKEERIKHFTQLKDALTKLVSDLKSSSVLINDPFSCTDDIYYDLTEIYKVQNLFTWEQMSDDWHMIPKESSCNVTASDGSETTVTLNEMKRAFELGIGSIDDIVKVKAQYGDIEGILK